MKEEQPFIFISYATPDRERVDKFADGLEKLGFNIWMDYRGVKAGQNWDFEIKRALNKATFFLMFISENSVNRRSYLQRELKMALDIFTEKLIDDIYLIPILLDKVTIPDEIKQFQYVDTNDPNCLKRIAESLNYQTDKLGVTRKEVQEKGNISWTSGIIKEVWDGLPGYEVELEFLTFQSDVHSNISEINAYIKGTILEGLFRSRAVKLEQSPDRFNFIQDRFSRTDTYSAYCGEPYIAGKVTTVQYTIDWYGAGAAHPNHHFETYSFILDPIILIENLETIFKDPETAFKVIQEITRKQLYNVRIDGGSSDEIIELDREHINSGTEAWKDFSSFVFLPDKIEILFAPYQIAAYAFGSHNVSISYDQIVLYMNDGYISALGLEYIKNRMLYDFQS